MQNRLTAAQERFIQAVAHGAEPTAAYQTAYPRCASARTASLSASRLLNHPGVQRRLVELDAVRLDRNWILQRLRAVIERALPDEIRPGEPDAVARRHEQVALRALELNPVSAVTDLTDDELAAMLADLEPGTPESA